MMTLKDAVILLYPYVVTLLYAATFITALFQYVSRAYCLPVRSERLLDYLEGPIVHSNQCGKRAKDVLLCVLPAFVISRMLILLIGFIGLEFKNEGMNLFELRKFIFTQWDASHYIGISENGYVNTGDARLHIVFYPLYPILVKGLNFLFSDSLVSAAVLSNACFIASGIILYMIVFEIYGKKTASHSVWLYMFSMGSVFYSVPYTESLFVCLTLLSVYFARKHRFYPAVFFGALSSFTRLPGAITAVPIFFEMIRSKLGYIRNDELNGTRLKRALRVTGVSFLKCLLILTGFLLYLLVNKLVTGDAFKFLEYQKNHWGQEAGNIFRTAAYSIDYLFHPFVKWYQFGVYLPQVTAILFACIVLFFVRKSVHPSDMAYSVVYLFVTLSPTMLISGPRYISAMYALYPFTAVLMKKNRILKAIIILFWCAFFIYSSYMFMVEWTYL